MLAPLGQAIDALTAEISGLLTVAPLPEVRLLSSTQGLTGIGGFIALNNDPVAEIFGRRLTSELSVRVLADTAGALQTAENQVRDDLQRADPALLRQNNIYKLKLMPDRDAPLLTPEDGITENFGRDVFLSVLFEHRPVPTVTEGVIGSVPTDITQATLSRTGDLVFFSDFETDPLGDFAAADRVGGTGTAGSWAYDAATQEVTQTGTTSGGNNGITANKVGTYLTLNPGVGGDVTNFTVTAEMQCGPTGGIGIVYRYQDIDNFGFVVLESPANIRVMGKRIAGAGSFLDEGGQDATQGYVPDTPFRLRLLADGDRFELAINEQTVLAGRDSALTNAGTVGFFCRRANTARFRHFRLSSL